MSSTNTDLVQGVQALRAKLDAAEHQPGGSSFSPVAESFFDLSEDAQFLAASESIDAKELTPTLQAVANAALGRKVVLSRVALFQVRGAGLKHGALMVNGWPSCFFVFEHGRGLVSFMAADGQMRISRFTAVVAAGEVAEG